MFVSLGIGAFFSLLFFSSERERLSHSLMPNSLSNPIDCSLPGSSVHKILQARILEWVTTFFSRGSSQLRHQTCISYLCCIGRQILYHLHHSLNQTIHAGQIKISRDLHNFIYCLYTEQCLDFVFKQNRLKYEPGA